MNKKLYKLIISLFIVITCILTFIDKKHPSFAEEVKNVCWDLQSLYESDEVWRKELKKFDEDTGELKNYMGKVTKSKSHLSFALDIKENLDIRINKLYAYPKLKKDTNKKSYVYLDMNEEVSKVYTKYAAICSDLELEILKLPESEYNKLISSNLIQKKYGMYLNDIKRSQKYYLDQKSESILSDVSPIASLPGQVYENFRNMDKDTKLTPSQYLDAIESYDREIRKEAYTNEFMAYNENINMLTALLTGQVNKNVFYSTQRGYSSSLDMYLKGDDIDSKIYNQLIDTVGKRTNSLHKYISMRKKILKVDNVHYYDMFVPIVNIEDNNITYDRGQNIIYSSLSPLGKEYSEIIWKAFNEKWIDVFSEENKVGGGYCLSVYDSHPYILVNYNNTIGSVSTIAHELGHATYEYISSKNQNYFNSSPSIFAHEVASTTNEALLYEVLIKNSTDNQQKAYYITKYLDLIKDTLYTQTMYAEFEKNIHEMIEEGKIVNARVFNDIWSSLLKKYYGADYTVDELGMVGWSRIPHFYNSFYVYQYATGCSAGVTFAQDILANGSKNYIDFLKKGSSNYPIKLLKDSGVDLNTTKPIEDTIKRFDDLLVELEKIVEQ